MIHGVALIALLSVHCSVDVDSKRRFKIYLYSNALRTSILLIFLLYGNFWFEVIGCCSPLDLSASMYLIQCFNFFGAHAVYLT